MNVPLAAPEMGEAELAGVREVMESGHLADGPEVRAFEREFAAYCGAERAVATTNGTTALHAALEALGVGPGDEVVTTPFTFVASANAVRLAGAEPVFADIDPETYGLDPEAVEEVVRARDDVAAVMPVHLYGLPADMDALLDVADEYDLAVVEDACQAHGAEWNGTRVGAMGDAAAFSFYPTKNMTTGEGGMVTTDREAVADRVASFANHGRREADDRGYEHAAVGHNYRLTSLGAAIGRAQLERLPALNEARRRNAAALTDALAETSLTTPVEPAGARHVYNQYTVRAENRDDLARHLDEHGIATGVYYPKPVHRQPAYADVAADVTAPEAERAAEEVLSLPVHPGVTDEQLRTIDDTITEYER